MLEIDGEIYLPYREILKKTDISPAKLNELIGLGKINVKRHHDFAYIKKSDIDKFFGAASSEPAQDSFSVPIHIKKSVTDKHERGFKNTASSKSFSGMNVNSSQLSSKIQLPKNISNKKRGGFKQKLKWMKIPSYARGFVVPLILLLFLMTAGTLIQNKAVAGFFKSNDGGSAGIAAAFRSFWGSSDSDSTALALETEQGNSALVVDSAGDGQNAGGDNSATVETIIREVPAPLPGDVIRRPELDSRLSDLENNLFRRINESSQTQSQTPAITVSTTSEESSNPVTTEEWERMLESLVGLDTESGTPTFEALNIEKGSLKNVSIEASTLSLSGLLTAKSANFSGNLGIGVINPSDRLAIDGAIYIASDDSPQDNEYRFYNTRGRLYWSGEQIAGAGLAAWKGNGTNAWRDAGFVGIGTPNPTHALSVVGDAYLTGSLLASSINLTEKSATSTVSGTLEVGSLSVGSSSTSYVLNALSPDAGPVAGFSNSNGTCTINPTTSSLVCSSDNRLKNNISGLDSGEVLQSLTELQAVSFKWLSDETDVRRVGFIAQEVEKIFPEFVSKDSEGFLSVSYGSFTPLVIEAVKELNFKLSDIENILDIENKESAGIFEIIVAALEKFGVSVKEGSVKTESIEVNNQIVNDSIEMTDSVTGEKYCIRIANGDWSKVLGACDISEIDDSGPNIYYGTVSEDWSEIKTLEEIEAEKASSSEASLDTESPQTETTTSFSPQTTPTEETATSSLEVAETEEIEMPEEISTSTAQ